MARSVPSSAVRSSANITNKLTSSSTPTRALNVPTVENSDRIDAPASAALSSTSSLAVATATPGTPASRSSSARDTSWVRSAPSYTPPSLDTSTAPRGGSTPAGAAAASADRVPGATNSPVAPARPSWGTTVRTRSDRSCP